MRQRLLELSDDSLATTFEPLACMDCRRQGFPAAACATRRHP
jgi:hypothetical protein